MPAYVVTENRVTDPEKFRKYLAAVRKLVAAHGGRPLVVADAADVREGKKAEPRTAILEFPSMAAARSWYESPEYQAVISLRLESTVGCLFMVEGFVPPST